MPIPHPLFGPGAWRGSGERLGAGSLYGDAVRLLRYGRGVDNSRLRTDLGYEPRYDAVSRDPGLRGRGPRAAAVPGSRRRLGARSPGRVGAMSAPTRSASIPDLGARFLRGVRTAVDGGLDPLTAAEAASADLPKTLRDAIERMARRMRGDYHEDEWGFDEEFAEAAYPFFELLYDAVVAGRGDRGRRTFPPMAGRCSSPTTPGAIFPFDASMITGAIMKEHPLPRWPRFMVLDWAFSLPFLSAFMRKVGGVPASPFNATRILEADGLMMVFPEGVKGTGKPFAERYRLQRFGRGGFVEVALRTGSPIVPVAVVGSEEIYPKIADSSMLARAIGAPYAPITPTFPWLGPLGLIPLPSKWRIEFCEPIDVSASGPRRPTIASSSSRSPSRSGRRSSRSSTRTSSSAVRHSSEPMADDETISLSEAARRSGVPETTLKRWASERVLPVSGGDWTAAAAAQARVIARMRDRGYSLREVRDAVRDGRLAFGSVEELLPTPTRSHSRAEAAAAVGLEEELIERIMALLGTPMALADRITDEDIERPRADGERAPQRLPPGRAPAARPGLRPGRPKDRRGRGPALPSLRPRADDPRRRPARWRWRRTWSGWPPS